MRITRLYIRTLLFTDFATAILFTLTFNTSLKRAEGGFAFNVIWKAMGIVPYKEGTIYV